MKRLIALIISIAMIASLATGLAVTSFALGGGPSVDVYFNGEGNDYFFVDSEEKGYSNWSNYSDTNYFSATTDTDGSITLKVEKNVVVDHIKATGDLKIDLNGKTLTVSPTDCDAIYVNDGNLTITGGGRLEAANIANEAFIYSYDTIEITGTGTTIIAKGVYGIHGNNIIINDGTSIEATVDATKGATGIWAENGGVTINGGTVKLMASGTGSYGIYSDKGVDISGGTVSATSLYSAIYARTDITISSGTVKAMVSGGVSNGVIYANNNANINGGTVEVTGGLGYGIRANNVLNISSNNVKAKAQTAFSSANGITVNGVSITDITLTNQYFYCDDGGELIYNANDIKSSPMEKWVYVKQLSNPDPEDDESDIEESDPDVEIDFGYGPVTVKTSGKSLVLNDKKIVEKEVLESNNLFIPFDLTKAYIVNTKQTKDFDAIFFNNDAYKYISGAGKGVELKTRFAKADVFKKDDIGQNPVSLHLSDVSEIPGTCATAIQKAAMQTSKVYAQVNYSFVTNGKPTENEAKIYVPVEGPAKVFYLFNESKIGIVPCEVIDGYCVFDRYYDGTYIVCAK